LSLRQVENILHERGIDISYETVRAWWNRFGPSFAAEIKKKRPAMTHGSPQWRCHLDEVFVSINGEIHYLWRAVDHAGGVLETFVTNKRGRKAALGFLKKALRRHGNAQEQLTERLRSYPGAMKQLGIEAHHSTGHRANNRDENSHQPFRPGERAMARFRSAKSLQMLVSLHASIYNHFNLERHLYNRQQFKSYRTVALNEWRQLAS
jgi:putative transposase